MSSEVNLKRASTYYFVGNIFNKGISFLTVPVFSRLLSTSDYGIVTTFNSWVAILSMVFGFAIYMGIRAAFIDYENYIDDFVSVASTFTIVSGLLISGAAVVIVSLLRVNVSTTLIILCCLQGLSMALIQNYSMYLMMKCWYKARTAFMILPNLFSALLSIIVVAVIMKNKLYLGRIIPTTVVYVIFGFFVVCFIYRKSQLLFSKEYLKYALRISAPLVLHGIALNVLSQSALTMITWLKDSSQAGVYSLIYNFSMIATVITTSLEGVWIPWFFKKMKDQNRIEINEKATDYIGLMAAALIGVILVGPEVVKILASYKYWEGISIIPPIVVANFFVFAYTLYVNIEHYYKRTIYITLNTIIAAIFNIATNYFLIPVLGYVAAAYTTVGSYILAFIMHAAYAKKIEPELYPFIKFVPFLFHIFLASIVFYLFIDIFIVRWLFIIVYYTILITKKKDTIMMYMPEKVRSYIGKV